MATLTWYKNDKKVCNHVYRDKLILKNSPNICTTNGITSCCKSFHPQISATTKPGDRTVSSELTILANVTDNQARYRCEAHNPATEIPLFETITLSVHFAPDTVKIQVEPEELKPNAEATIRCDSSSSNPPAELSWWRDGIPVESPNIVQSSKAGLWGGTTSSTEMKINVTQDMNGVVYTCQSANTALDRSVHEVATLHVLCKLTDSRIVMRLFN